MIVLSLFDGISCGRVALERAGIPVTKYYASEIDKYAISVSKKNYPDIVHVGDICNLRSEDFKDVDLIIGGSPCTNLSKAGDRTGLQGKESRLFFEYVRLLKEVKPKYFLLENVNMKKEWADEISNILGVQPVKINSSLVSAQNRVRLYWTNIPNVTQPEDKGILLQDVLEEGVTERTKSLCLTATYGKGETLQRYLTKGNRQLIFTGGALRGRYLIDGVRQDSKVDTLKGLTKQRLELNKEGKSNCLTKVQKDSLVVRLGHLGKGGQGERVYSVQGKSVCLSAKGGGRGAKTGLYLIDLPDGDYYVRKLTPIECERLQTLPDGYTALGCEGETISNTQRYKMLGNGWTVDVIVHIFKGFLENT
jgi:DNA (cytosine-5)-methyltransferase 3A